MTSNKNKKIALIILAIVLLVLIIAFAIIYNTSYIPDATINEPAGDYIKDLPEIIPDNMKTELKAVVVKVNKNYLDVKANDGKLYYANHSKNEQFKIGQEITIYYNEEKIINTNPAVRLDVGNISIEKEVSEIAISEEDLEIFNGAN